MVGLREVTCEKCGQKKEELILPRFAIIVTWALLSMIMWRLARVQGVLIVAVFALIVYMVHEVTIKKCLCKKKDEDESLTKKKKKSKKRKKKKSRGKNGK